VTESGAPAIRVEISDQRLDVAALIGGAAAPECGGIGVFVGTVRVTPAGDGDAPVIRLDYEAHPTLAEDRLRSIAEEAAAKWDLRRVTAVHRTGPCELGEPTVVVACGAPHRGDALEACRWIIDTIKTTVPIWKREVYANGSAWLGSEGTEAGEGR
jgi:molybdopterin synthase catalytic subunit